jgi:hypothetical protein
MFFQAGSAGGRLVVDLGEVRSVRQINTYSWHPAVRGPQCYTLFASDGASSAFQARPARTMDPASNGWTKLAAVDTKPQDGDPGGQHGVSVTAEEPGALLGSYRYLLFDILRTGLDARFDQTFFTEFDVLGTGPAEAVSLAAAEAEPIEFATGDGRYQFTMEMSAAPDLAAWAERELAPVVREWYPKIVALLPSEGFEAPDRVTIRFRTNMGGTPASASGNRVNCNAGWFRRNLQGEARGSVVHEMVHVVQQYGRARRANPNATRTPGWIVEGIPDYIRWFLYEPETRGAEITRRNLERARYDASYRITGNFLDWVVTTFDRDLVRNLNAAAREGNYRESLWETWTGQRLETLGTQWREGHVKRLAE